MENMLLHIEAFINAHKEIKILWQREFPIYREKYHYTPPSTRELDPSHLFHKEALLKIKQNHLKDRIDEGKHFIEENREMKQLFLSYMKRSKSFPLLTLKIRISYVA